MWCWCYTVKTPALETTFIFFGQKKLRPYFSRKFHPILPSPSPLAKSHGFLRWRNAFLQVLLVQISTKLQSHARSVRRDLCVVKLVGSPGATEHFGRENGRKQHAACIDFHIFQWIFGGGSRGFLIDPREWSKMRCIKECITASITWNSPHLDHLEFTSFRVTYYYILLSWNHTMIIPSHLEFVLNRALSSEATTGHDITAMQHRVTRRQY